MKVKYVNGRVYVKVLTCTYKGKIVFNNTKKQNEKK